MIKQAEKKKSRASRVLLPIIGLFMGLALFVLSYFAAPFLIRQVRSQEIRGVTVQEFNQRLGITDDSELENSLPHIATTILIWIVSFSFLILIVSMAIGQDPERDNVMLHPRRSDMKELKKYASYLEAEQKKRAKLIKEKQKRDARNAKKNR